MFTCTFRPSEKIGVLCGNASHEWALTRVRSISLVERLVSHDAFPTGGSLNRTWCRIYHGSAYLLSAESRWYLYHDGMNGFRHLLHLISVGGSSSTRDSFSLIANRTWSSLTDLYAEVGLALPREEGLGDDNRRPGGPTLERCRRKELPAGLDVRSAAPASELLVMAFDDVLSRRMFDDGLACSMLFSANRRIISF